MKQPYSIQVLVQINQIIIASVSNQSLESYKKFLSEATEQHIYNTSLDSLHKPYC